MMALASFSGQDEHHSPPSGVSELVSMEEAAGEKNDVMISFVSPYPWPSNAQRVK